MGGNFKSEGGWAAHYNKDCSVFNLEDGSIPEESRSSGSNGDVVDDEVHNYDDIDADVDRVGGGEENVFDSDVDTVLTYSVPDV